MNADHLFTDFNFRKLALVYYKLSVECYGGTRTLGYGTVWKICGLDYYRLWIVTLGLWTYGCELWMLTSYCETETIF